MRPIPKNIKNPRNITFYALKPHPTITQRIAANPWAVGRVTPCAPRLQPMGTNFPRRRLPNPLPITAFLEFSGFFAICSGIGLRSFGVGLGERTRPRVRRLTPRQPRPRAPPRVAPAWPGTRDFGISPANRRRAGFQTCVPGQPMVWHVFD